MVADWDGQGLPPIAAERARRAAAGGAWTSLLTAPAAAGLQVAGFEPVGEVMGSIVQQIGWTGYRGCGMYGGGFAGWDTTTVSAAGRLTGYGPYVDALNHGYETAMSRMLAGGRDDRGGRRRRRRAEDGPPRRPRPRVRRSRHRRARPRLGPAAPPVQHPPARPGRREAA